MRTFITSLAVCIFLTACQTHPREATQSSSITIDLTGTTGGAFTGFYVQGGRRIEFSGALPWSRALGDIAEFEVHKVHRDYVLRYGVSYDEVGGSARATQSGEIPVGLVGVRCRVVEHGLSAERF